MSSKQGLFRVLEPSIPFEIHSELAASAMAKTVDLYNSSYGNYELDAYREVRIETYGEDLGQTSWVNAEESKQIPKLLGVNSSSVVLEVGSGSGRYALRLAELTRCEIKGVDINPHGIRNSNELAEKLNLTALARFEQCDVSKPLPFADSSFDAVFSNDVICHITNRQHILAEVFRVLRRGGQFLFSDALVIGGLISDQEIATRSSIGNYLFSPPDENERLLAAAGFELIFARDTTHQATEISKRRFDARLKRKSELVAAEGEANFEGQQRFLACVQTPPAVPVFGPQGGVVVSRSG
jgi:SAM-dependent methyltransferase